jgi:hypothetical protein
MPCYIVEVEVGGKHEMNQGVRGVVGGVIIPTGRSIFKHWNLDVFKSEFCMAIEMKETISS